MKRYLIILLFILQQNISFGQLIFSPNAINFNNKNVFTLDSIKLNVKNNHAFDVNFEKVYLIEKIGTAAITNDFFIKINNLSIAQNTEKSFYIYFYPKQNIEYNTELILESKKLKQNYAIDIQGKGRCKEAYYDSTYNLFGEALKGKLKSIMSSGYISLGYNTARDNMYASIDNVGGEVECVYTGRKATFNTRAGATAQNFNCEHTFPQGFFSQNEPMRSDIHHLFSSDEAANSKRDNDPFNMVSNPTWQVGGSKWANNQFEPRDIQKGPTARAMLYFVNRWQNYSNFLTNQEDTLRAWCFRYQVTAKEMNRNNSIFSLQKNRNAYIDHPEFLYRIPSISNTKEYQNTICGLNLPDTLYFGTLSNQTDSVSYQLIIANTGNTQVNYTFHNGSNSNLYFSNSNKVVNNGASETNLIILKPKMFQTQNVFDSLQYYYLCNGFLVKKYVYVKANINATIGVKQVKQYNLKAYPNPFNNSLVLNFENKQTDLNIYNQMGQLIYFAEINGTSTEINTCNWPSGVYFVKGFSENQLYTKTIIKINK